jgi:hypothetical protein
VHQFCLHTRDTAPVIRVPPPVSSRLWKVTPSTRDTASRSPTLSMEGAAVFLAPAIDAMLASGQPRPTISDPPGSPRPRISATHVVTSVVASPPAQPHCAPPRWDHPSAPPLRDGIREQQGHRDGIWEEASGPPPSSTTSSYVPLHPLRTLPTTITRPSGPGAPHHGRFCSATSSPYSRTWTPSTASAPRRHPQPICNLALPPGAMGSGSSKDTTMGSESDKRSSSIFSDDLVPSPSSPPSPSHHHHPAKRAHCCSSHWREVLLCQLLPLFLDMPHHRRSQVATHALAVQATMQCMCASLMFCFFITAKIVLDLIWHCVRAGSCQE